MRPSSSTVPSHQLFNFIISTGFFSYSFWQYVVFNLLQDAHEETKVVTRASEMKGIIYCLSHDYSISLSSFILCILQLSGDGWRRMLTKLVDLPVLSNLKLRSLTKM